MKPAADVLPCYFVASHWLGLDNPTSGKIMAIKRSGINSLVQISQLN